MSDETISTDEVAAMALEGRVQSLSGKYLLFFPDRVSAITVDVPTAEMIRGCTAIAQNLLLTEDEIAERYPDAYARWKARR